MIRTIPAVEEMQKTAATLKQDGKTIGLVPTMGYFHEGHLSLMRRSVEDNDVTIVTLFVNPTQFGQNEDLDAYPRDFERDKNMAEEAGVDYIFRPANDDMYPGGYKTYVKVEDWSSLLCGASRPVHFRGVTTICCKLFNICRPDRAYFGLKDAQQYLVLQKMVRDLNMNLELVPMPIVREGDGLAMSSRNVYLTRAERGAAVLLSRSLAEAKEKISGGETDAESIKRGIRDRLNSSEHVKIDYVEAVSTETLDPVSDVAAGTLIAVAAYLGKARLIDNIII